MAKSKTLKRWLVTVKLPNAVHYSTRIRAGQRATALRKAEPVLRKKWTTDHMRPRGMFTFEVTRIK